MAFKRLDPQDLVISTDSVAGAMWSNNTPTLTTFFTSSTQIASNTAQFYYSVYQTESTNTSAAIQFDIAYCDQYGSGSLLYNPNVNGLSPTRTNYGQYRTLILGDEYSQFVFGTVTSSDFWALSIDRSRYKEKLFPGSLSLTLSGSGGRLTLTDDSQVSPTVVFNDAGRVYQIVSGSLGTVYTGVNANGYSAASGSYGWFLPDIGTILLNPLAISASIQVSPSRSSNSDGLNYRAIFNSIKLGSSFMLNSQETISSDYIFIRARNAEFNYTENPSFISGSSGEIVFSSFINNPQTFPTTIGLYNSTNELLAVAKLSRPLLKDFTKEALVRVKLDF
jgi:hypothetical protein